MHVVMTMNKIIKTPSSAACSSHTVRAFKISPIKYLIFALIFV